MAWVYYTNEECELCKDNIVTIRSDIKDRYQIDNLIVGKRRVARIGKSYKIQRVYKTQGGHIRITLEGMSIIWSPKMLEKLEREVNEI